MSDHTVNCIPWSQWHLTYWKFHSVLIPSFIYWMCPWIFSVDNWTPADLWDGPRPVPSGRGGINVALQSLPSNTWNCNSLHLSPHPPLPPHPSKYTKLSTAPQALSQRCAVTVTWPVYDSHITYVSCLWGHQQTRLMFCERKCFGGVRVEVR